MASRSRIIGLAVVATFTITAAACSTAPGSADSAAGPAGVRRPVVALTPEEQAARRNSAFPGDVASGSVRWGAAVGGNSDPFARHESTAGVPMGLRRTYFGWDNRMKAVTTAKADLAVGRLPWVSFKTPGWAAMASGVYDAQIDDLLRALDGAGGPVWLTVNHEPENDGGNPADWRAMQAKVRERMDAVGTSHVAFSPVLMTWTFDARSGRNPDDWFVPGIWDFAGLDSYSESVSNTTVEIAMWLNARAYFTAKGMKIAVGEWGNRGTDATAAAEMRAFYDMAIASGASGQSQVIGLAYFDSDLNSPKGGWTLAGAALEEFRSLMKASTSLTAQQSTA